MCVSWPSLGPSSHKVVRSSEEPPLDVSDGNVEPVRVPVGGRGDVDGDLLDLEARCRRVLRPRGEGKQSSIDVPHAEASRLKTDLLADNMSLARRVRPEFR